MIYPDHEILEAERYQRIAGRGDQFGFNYHRTRTEHVNIALIELSESSASGAIGPPHGLNLVALEKLRQFVLILGDDTSQRHGQIVAQRQIRFAGLFVFAALENFEDELIAFLAIFSPERLDVFNSGSFQGLETVAFVDFLNHADDVLAFADLFRKKVAHTARWLCLG